jgi:hypothetical protein
MAVLLISYSRSDQRLVRGVVNLLKASFHSIERTVFWDTESEAQEVWSDRFKEEIDAAGQLFVFWCVHSAKSIHVELEYLYALTGGKRVVPVLLDDTPLPSRLAHFHGIDLRAAVNHNGSTDNQPTHPVPRVTPEPRFDHRHQIVQKFASRFYSCFISYSTDDELFAQRLYKDLTRKGIRCWFAPHDILGGRTVLEQVVQAINEHDRVLLILSDSSMKSSWVRTEIEHARAKERAKSDVVLFPIALTPYEKVRTWTQFNADIGDDNARRIREFYIPDFSNWNEQNAYSDAFSGLVKALRASEKE